MMSKPAFLPVAMLCTALFVSACGGRAPTLGPTSTAVSVRSELPVPDPVAAAQPDRTFVLGPFDTVSVSVFGAPELTREGMIDSSGNFSLPLIGQIRAAGQTPEQLETAIADRLRGPYVRNPEVTVSVTKIQSRTVTVDGAVKRPGVYPVTARTSLQQAVAMAEGAAEFAQLREVVVFRTVDNQRMAALFDLEAIRAGRMADPMLYGDDIVVVGTNDGRRRFREIVQAIPVLGIFTPVVN